MKKLLGIVAFLLCLFPMSVKAQDGITKYKIDVTVLENGDIAILEAFTMSGKYNGFERIINYKSNFNSYYGNKLSSTGDNSIYNGSGITLNEIRGIDFNDTKTLLELQANGDLFEKVNSASKGDYGKYTVTHRNIGDTYLIYNHSKMNKDFFLAYTLKDMVVTHRDIAELGYNIFTELTEDVEHLEVMIHIPNNQELLRVWAHGPLNGTSEIVDSQTLKIVIDDLEAHQAIDFRIVFDKDVIQEANKVTQIDAMDTILEIEQKLADEANDERNRLYRQLQEDTYEAVMVAERTKNRSDYNHAYSQVQTLKDNDELKTELLLRLMNLESQVERKETILKVAFTSITVGWILGLMIMIYYIYQKYDKEYELQFKEKYFRDFPASYGPATVGYLLHRKIKNDDLSASILDLIQRKIIGYEDLGKDYKLIKLEPNQELTKSEQYLIKFLFDEEDTITLSQLQKKAKKNYSSFITRYSNWLNRATLESELEKFYEDLTNCKVIGILYSVIGIVLGICLIGKPVYFSTLFMTLLGIGSLIYFCTFTKKTVKGNEEYAKWLALKRFMEDFGKMDTKELPEVELWDKYLVYAISLGCADKLAKQMRIKIDEFQTSGIEISNTMLDMSRLNYMLNFNRVINQSIQKSISTAYSAKIASSESSSGSGFGGGFSGGSFTGGSFGGGGGGGRF